MPTQPYIFIDPPQLEPYKYGLFSAVQPIMSEDGHWRIGGVEFDSLAAYDAAPYPVGIGQFAGAGGTKTLPGWNGTTKGLPFGVYAGVACGSVGREDDDSTARALAVLALAAPYAVETELWTGSGGGAPTLNAPADALHVTVSGTATSLDLALVALENWLGDNYNGRGVIHAKRGVAVRAAQRRLTHVDPDNMDRLVTPLGTGWAFGAGYNGTGPGAVAPAANQTWIYATGQVGILRDTAETPADLGAGLNRVTNQVTVLAEQIHLLTVDGLIGAALVDLTL